MDDAGCAEVAAAEPPLFEAALDVSDDQFSDDSADESEWSASDEEEHSESDDDEADRWNLDDQAGNARLSIGPTRNWLGRCKKFNDANARNASKRGSESCIVCACILMKNGLFSQLRWEGYSSELMFEKEFDGFGTSGHVWLGLERSEVMVAKSPWGNYDTQKII